MKKQIVVNILSNYAGRIVSLALSFALTPFLVHKLGIEAFGVIVFFESLVQFVEMTCEGLRLALSRHAAFSLSKGMSEELSAYFSTGRVIFLAIAAAVLAVGLPLSAFVTDVFQIPDALGFQSKVLFAIMVIAFAMRMPNAVDRSGLYARHRYDLINLAVSSAAIVRAVVILVLFTWLPANYVSLPVYGTVYLATSVAQNIFFSVTCRRVLPGLRVPFSGFDVKKMKEILSFGFYTMVSHLSSASHESFIIILINLFWGPAYNALYAIGVKFADLMESFFKEPVWSLTPTFTTLAAQNNREKVEELLFIFTKGLALVTVPACVFLMVYADWIILAWVGPTFQPAVVLMVVSLLPEIISLPLSACESFGNAYAKLKVPSIVNAVTVVLSLGLGYCLAVPLHWGLPGLAWGVAITTIAYSIFYLAPYACHISGISLSKYWVQAYLKPSVWACLFWGAAFYIIMLFEKSPLSPVSVLIFIGLTAVYGAGSYLWFLDPSEKGRFSEVLKMAGNKWA